MADTYRVHNYTAAPQTDKSPPTGCSLEQYAKAKCLPVEFLKQLGITEETRREKRMGDVYDEVPYLRIPYYSPSGQEVALRHRLSLSEGKRFDWRPGDKTNLYGTEDLEFIRSIGWCLLVEGESDTQTLRYHSLPVLGMPGNRCWNEDSHLPLFDGIDNVFVVIEPGESGQGMLKWISKSALRDRIRLLRLDRYKDISDLHVAMEGDYNRIFDVLEPAFTKAERYGVIRLERASDLLKQEIEPLEWFVNEYIPEGLTLLVGTPKLGKSWLCLAIAEACASGRSVLGRQTKRCNAVYFALEDSPRRYKERLNLLLGGRPCPDGLFEAYHLPSLDNGLVDHLELTLDHYKDVRMVIIDTLGMVRAGQKSSQQIYDFDVDTLRGVAMLARSRRIAIIFTHHVRKSHGDALEMVNGSYGLVGTADTIIVMTIEKEAHTARFRALGRDLPDQYDKLVTFDQATFQWQVGDDYSAASEDQNQLDLRIVEYLRKADGPTRPLNIAGGLFVTVDKVNKRLKKLLDQKLVEKGGHGLYCLPDLPKDETE